MEIDTKYLKLELKPLSELNIYYNIPGEPLDKKIRSESGVYILCEDNGNVLYIGQSKIVRNRISSHTSFNSRSASWVDKKRVKIIYVLYCDNKLCQLIEQAYKYFLDSEFNDKGHATEFNGMGV